jgi:hypothetical protein
LHFGLRTAHGDWHAVRGDLCAVLFGVYAAHSGLCPVLLRLRAAHFGLRPVHFGLHAGFCEACTKLCYRAHLLFGAPRQLWAWRRKRKLKAAKQQSSNESGPGSRV